MRKSFMTEQFYCKPNQTVDQVSVSHSVVQILTAASGLSQLALLQLCKVWSKLEGARWLPCCLPAFHAGQASVPSLSPCTVWHEHFSDKKPFIDCLISLITLFYGEKPIIFFILLTTSFSGKLVTSLCSVCSEIVSSFSSLRRLSS